MPLPVTLGGCDICAEQDLGFENACDSHQPDVGGDTIADRVDRPSRVTIAHLLNTAQQRLTTLIQQRHFAGGRGARKGWHIGRLGQ